MFKHRYNIKESTLRAKENRKYLTAGVQTFFAN
jgi:hypothetical protein